MSKTNSKVIGSAGESNYVVEHEGLEIKGNGYTGIADAVVTSTPFTDEGLYLVKDTTNNSSAVIAVIVESGVFSTIKIGGSTDITITADTADSMNVYILGGVVAVQNLMGVEIGFTVKAIV